MSWRYLAACKPNAVRVGLQGEEAGIVDEQQAEHAAQTLAQSREAVVARKAQRKEFFKKQRAEQNKTARKFTPKAKKPASNAPAASAESLAALATKFGR